jgi:HSP20 family protein
MALSIVLTRPQHTHEEELLFPEAALHGGIGPERRLAIDAYETAFEVVVRALIPGTLAEDVEVFLHSDLLTIRGRSRRITEPGSRALTEECDWGSFSRSLVLPTATDAEGIVAELNNGVLTLHIPKVHRARKIGVRTV